MSNPKDLCSYLLFLAGFYGRFMAFIATSTMFHLYRGGSRILLFFNLIIYSTIYFTYISSEPNKKPKNM